MSYTQEQKTKRYVTLQKHHNKHVFVH